MVLVSLRYLLKTVLALHGGVSLVSCFHANKKQQNMKREIIKVKAKPLREPCNRAGSVTRSKFVIFSGYSTRINEETNRSQLSKLWPLL